jgi:aquaporin Z
MGSMQKLLAELFGTFTLVFVGSMSVVAALRFGGGGGVDSVLLVSVALGFGLALLIGLYAFAEVSGGHFNPAVSLAMFLDKRLPAGDLIGYWVAQFAGATLGSLVVLIAFNSDTVASTATTFTDTRAAFVTELVLTALFVAVILQVTRSDTYGRSALTAIPLALVAIHVAAIPISGASVNPARSFASALVGTEFGDLWLYFIAPPIGAVLGWIVHKVVVMGDTDIRGDLKDARASMS